MPTHDRVKALQRSLKTSGIDALLISGLANIRYLSGFSGSSAHVLITGKQGFFFTDSRYFAEVTDAPPAGFKVQIYKNSFFDILKRVERLGIKKLGVESGVFTVDSYNRLKTLIAGSPGKFGGVKLLPTTGFVEGARIVKDPSEVDRIRDAIAVSKRGFSSIERAGLLGRSEREVAFAIEVAVRKPRKNCNVAEAMGFDTIVASGKLGAKPHAVPTDKVIKTGELVTIDMGVSLDGYKSDETRTYGVGRLSKRHRDIYATVKDAHDRAIDCVKAGVKASKVDSAARRCIKKAGYGKYFGHGTGHGVGLDVHEAPYISPKSDTILRAGMVITIEPGIYIPDFGGVRIEDMVLVCDDGFEVLTDPSKKELRIL